MLRNLETNEKLEKLPKVEAENKALKKELAEKNREIHDLKLAAVHQTRRFESKTKFTILEFTHFT